jgi:hypothetical protein
MNLNGQVMMSDVFPSMFPTTGDCGCGEKSPLPQSDGIYVVANGRAVQIGPVSPAIMAALSLAVEVDGGEPVFGKPSQADCRKKFQALYKKYIDDNGLRCTLENCLTAYGKVNTTADYQAVALECAGVLSGQMAVAGCC